MRVLFSLLDAGVGGGQRVATGIAERLIHEGHDVGLVVPADGPTREAFARMGARTFRVQVQRIRQPGGVGPLVRVLREHDLLYSHTAIGGQVLGDAAARLARAPHLVHQHTFPYFSPDPREAALQRSVFRLLLARRPFIAVAPHVRDELVRLGASPSRVEMIENGVQLPTTVTVPAEPPRRIGMLGRFDPGKGMATFVDAVRSLGSDASGAGVEFVIGGSSGSFGDHERDLRAAARAGSVLVETPGADGGAFLRSLDIVVMPSHYEGSPLVLLEAMAAGRPVVASDIPGVRHITGDDGALLVPVGNAAAVAAALGRLLEDPTLRSTLAQRGRSIVAKRFTLDRSLDRTTSAIRAAAG